MTTKSKKNFLGIPISGEVNSSRRIKQKELSELEPFIQAVLDDPHVEAFGWAQYTPYFNDGEPCVFGLDEIGFRLVADKPDLLNFEDNEAGDEDQDEDEEYSETEWGHYSLYSHPKIGKYLDDDEIEAEYQNTAKVCREFAEQIDSGEFNDVLYEAFGDHANVTIRREGIVLDTYEHD